MSEQDIFERALPLSGEERLAFLAHECGDDSALRKRVEALLAAYGRAGEFLESPAAGPPATIEFRPLLEGPGSVIGPYRLLQKIGEGGFGAVYMAEQEQLVRRQVALKIIKAGMDTREVIARFESERQALALMDHPHIAKVLDAGATNSGRPYFVMELVKGVPITEFCDRNHLAAEARLKLFIDVCHAIQHAHHKGIIHRDVKPGNVLVTLHDGVPVVKVIDFGVAKATVQKLTERTLFTAFGQMVGTPVYMSPEQAEMSGLDIDTRTDVYSLGVLLYELLTGTTPLDIQRLRAAGYAEMQRLIREEEPPTPSHRISSLGDSATILAGNRGTDVRRLSRLLSGDLDCLILKALEKDRNRRYATPGNFAEDIERYLHREPIQARPQSALYKLRKFTQRNRSAVAMVLVLAAALLSGAGVSTWQAVRATLAERATRAALSDKTIALAAGAVAHKQMLHAIAMEKAAQQHAQQMALNQMMAREEAEQAELETMLAYRESTDDVIKYLIGSKPEVGPLEKTYLEKTLQRWQAFATRQGTDERSLTIRGEGHFRVALLWKQLGRLDEALPEYRAAREIRQQLVEHFSSPRHRQTLAHTHHNLAAVLASTGKPEEALAECRTARDIQSELVQQFGDEQPLYKQELARAHNSLGIILKDLGRSEAAQDEYQLALDLQKQLRAKFPSEPTNLLELACTHNNLAVLQRRLGRLHDAEAEYRAARDLHRQLGAEFGRNPEWREEFADTHRNLGNALKDLGRHEAALHEYQVAFDLNQELADQFPAVPEYLADLAATRNNWGLLLCVLGKREDAVSQYQAARTIQARLVDQYPGVLLYQVALTRTLNNLGEVLSQLGKRQEALGEYQAAREMLRKLAELPNALPSYRQELAGIQNSLGNVLFELGREEESLAEFQAARDNRSELARTYASEPKYRHELARTQISWAPLLHDLGKGDYAVSELQAAIAILQPLCDQAPELLNYRQDLGRAHNNLGVIQRRLGKLPEAQAAHLASRDIRLKLVEECPDVPEYLHELAASHHSLANAHVSRKEFGPAIREYQAARKLRQELADKFHGVPAYRNDLANTWANLARALGQQQSYAEARGAFQTACEIQERLAAEFRSVPAYQIALGLYYRELGATCLREGKPSNAIEPLDRAVRELTAVYGRHSQNTQAKLYLFDSHLSRAVAYDRLQRPAGAAQDWDRAAELCPPSERPALLANSALSKCRAGLAIEAVTLVTELVKNPNWPADTWYNFACVYSVASGKVTDKRQEYADRAMDFLAKAVQKGFKDADHMAKDDDLSPLRGRDDFAKLLSDIRRLAEKRD